MDSFRIALRFRDVLSKIDTIEEHRAIIQSHGRVMWGWWKKEFESNCSNILTSLSAESEFRLALVDRSNERQYIARCVSVIHGDIKCLDEYLIPDYYVHNKNKVYAWFVLVDICDDNYRIDIANAFRDSTLLDCFQLDSSEGDAVSSVVSSTGRKSILHLSDLHFGEDYRFLPPKSTPNIGAKCSTFSNSLFLDLQRASLEKDIGAIVVTGDLTTKADWSYPIREMITNEFDDLCDRLKIKRNNIIIVPGNHDIQRYPNSDDFDVRRTAVASQISYDHEIGFRNFMSEFTGNSSNYELNNIILVKLMDVDVYIASLNSCVITSTNWTEYGFVGDGGGRIIDKLEALNSNREFVKILALHHHLLPVIAIQEPGSRGVSLTLDAADILDRAQKSGVSIALHGHQHKAKISSYRSLMGGGANNKAICVIANGSSGAIQDRLPAYEKNTYSVITPESNKVHVLMRELRSDGEAGVELYNGYVCE